MAAETAPITQLYLTVLVSPPAQPLNPIQLSDVFQRFRGDYPLFEQVARAGPMQLPDDADGFIALGGPRTRFGTADGSECILFQEDRMTYAWMRTADFNEDAGYPGYDAIFAKALAHWSVLREHLPMGEAIVGEIIYANALPMGKGENQNARLSSVINVLNPDFQAKFSNYNFTWQEPYEHGGFVETTVTGPMLTALGQPFTHLQSMTRFRLAEGWTGLEAAFTLAHTALNDQFKKVVADGHRPG